MVDEMILYPWISFPTVNDVLSSELMLLEDSVSDATEPWIMVDPFVVEWTRKSSCPVFLTLEHESRIIFL
jgi:hypothetical protein